MALPQGTFTPFATRPCRIIRTPLTGGGMDGENTSNKTLQDATNITNFHRSVVRKWDPSLSIAA